MKHALGQFNEEVLAQFAEEYSFRTCQRSDGSYYGTGGQCRKGTETDKVEKEEKKGKGGGGDTATSADLKTKVEVEVFDSKKMSMVPKTVTLAEAKKDDSMLRSIEASPQKYEGKTKQAVDKVLMDDFKSTQSKVINHPMDDKTMGKLMTGVDRGAKQQYQSVQDAKDTKYPQYSLGRVGLKNTLSTKDQYKDFVDNKTSLTSLVSKVRSGKASDAEKAKYAEKFFGYNGRMSDKNVDRLIKNLNSI